VSGPDPRAIVAAAPTAATSRVIQRCSHCHSEDVVRDAWASWSFETQEWELGQAFDHAYCQACESDCTIETIPEDGLD